MVASKSGRVLGSCAYFLEVFSCLLHAIISGRLHVWFPRQIRVFQGMRAMHCRCQTPTKTCHFRAERHQELSIYTTSCVPNMPAANGHSKQLFDTSQACDP